MKHTPPQRRIGWLALALMAMLLFSACRPDDTLDITPSPTPTPEPSPTPTPTPLPEGFEEKGNPNELALEALIELLPTSLPAGEVQWNRDISRGDERPWQDSGHPRHCRRPSGSTSGRRKAG